MAEVKAERPPAPPIAGHDDRRMSDAEALMWRVEKDPFLTSTFGSVSILERPADFGRLRDRMERAVAAVPRLGWRVQPGRGDLGPPTWADDPDFDIDRHVRRLSLPAPGTERQLLDLATQFVADPLDRTRPLWQFVVVDGLAGGRGAVLQKMHHTITDGINAVRLGMQYMDVDPDAPGPAPGSVTERVVEPIPPPSTLDVVRGLVGGSFRIPLTLTRQVTELLADPAAIPRVGAEAVDTVQALITQLGDTQRARSPLWTERSLRRRVETVRLPFRPIKDAGKRLGGTVNTSFLTAVSDAAARYHIERDAPVDHLRATMAVSTRTKDSGANAFSLVRMLVPTGEMKLRDRFAAVAEAAQTASDSSGAATLDVVAKIASVLPTSLLVRLGRTQAQTVDFATSNVKASPVPVYIAGAKLIATYPMGPLVGVAANITLVSYDGNLDIGVNTDAAAIDDPARFARLIGQSGRALAKLKR